MNTFYSTVAVRIISIVSCFIIFDVFSVLLSCFVIDSFTCIVFYSNDQTTKKKRQNIINSVWIFSARRGMFCRNWTSTYWPKPSPIFKASFVLSALYFLNSLLMFEHKSWPHTRCIGRKSENSMKNFFRVCLFCHSVVSFVKVIHSPEHGAISRFHLILSWILFFGEANA